mmetsp:Transcript_33870/g.91681  ORF Transcript_33870/g.91681 Transcript_33870/m.91681 type:complete len:535 (+) Transcript_33870:185-1789(+)
MQFCPWQHSMHRDCDVAEALHRRQNVVQLVVPPIILVLLLGREPPLRGTLRGQVWLCSLIKLHRARGVHVHALVVVFPVVGARRQAVHALHTHGLPLVLLGASLDGGDRAHGPPAPAAAAVLRLLQPLQLPEVRGVVVVLLLHLLADGDEVPDALDVVGVRAVDLLVKLQRLRVRTHAPIARGHHEPPLHLVGLDLRCPAEEGYGGLVHLLLHVVDAEPCDDIHVHGPVPVGLEVVVEGLRLVAGLVEEVGEARKHARVGRPPLGRGDEQGEPLVRLGVVAELLVDVTELPHHLALTLRDGDQLVEGKERLLVLAYVHVDQAEVIDGIQAVCADSDGLEINLLGTLEFVVHEHAIAFVHEGTCVVAVGLDRYVGVLLRVHMVRLKEVEEGEVCCSTRHEGGLLPLELLEHHDGLVKLLPPQEVGGLGNLQLGANPREPVVVQRVDDPVEAGNRGFLHDRCDQVRGINDKSGRLALPSLDVLSESIVALCQCPAGILGGGGRVPELQLLLVEVLQPDLLNVQQLQEAALHLLLVT